MPDLGTEEPWPSSLRDRSLYDYTSASNDDLHPCSNELILIEVTGSVLPAFLLRGSDKPGDPVHPAGTANGGRRAVRHEQGVRRAGRGSRQA